MRHPRFAVPHLLKEAPRETYTLSARGTVESQKDPIVLLHPFRPQAPSVEGGMLISRSMSITRLPRSQTATVRSFDHDSSSEGAKNLRVPKRHIAPGCALVSGHGSVVDSIRISRARPPTPTTHCVAVCGDVHARQQAEIHCTVSTVSHALITPHHLIMACLT